MAEKTWFSFLSAWTTNEFLSLLRKYKVDVADNKLPPWICAGIASMVYQKHWARPYARTILDDAFKLANCIGQSGGIS